MLLPPVCATIVSLSASAQHDPDRARPPCSVGTPRRHSPSASADHRRSIVARCCVAWHGGLAAAAESFCAAWPSASSDGPPQPPPPPSSVQAAQSRDAPAVLHRRHAPSASVGNRSVAAGNAASASICSPAAADGSDAPVGCTTRKHQETQAYTAAAVWVWAGMAGGTRVCRMYEGSCDPAPIAIKDRFIAIKDLFIAIKDIFIAIKDRAASKHTERRPILQGSANRSLSPTRT